MFPLAMLCERDRMSYDEAAALLWLGCDREVEGVGDMWDVKAANNATMQLSAKTLILSF